MSEMSLPSRGMYTFWLLALILLWIVNRSTSRLPFSVNLWRRRWKCNSVDFRCIRMLCVCGRHSLGRFLYCPVSVEGLKLLLDSNQRVCKLAVVEDDDGLLNPLQQIRRQRFIFLDHLLGLDGVVEHLEKTNRF